MISQKNSKWVKIADSKIVAILLILFFFTFRFHNELFSFILIGGGFDQAVIFSPLFIKISSILSNGESALWLPELLGGIPIYHSPLMSAHYPFYFFRIFDFTEWIGSYRTMTLIALFHIFIYGLSIWYLLLQLEIKNLPASLIGSASIGSGMLYFHSKWIIALAGFTWIPLFFAGIILLFKSKNSLKGVFITAFSFSMIVLAKPSQPTIYTFYLGLIFVLLMLFLYKNKLKSLSPKLVLTALLILGITSVVLIPILENTGLYIRPSSKGTEIGNNLIPTSSYSDGINFSNFKYFIQYSLKSMGMGNAYIGSIIFALFPFGLIDFFMKKKGDLKYILAFLLIIGIYSFISSFGTSSFFFELNRKIPLMNQLRHPLRFLFFTNIVLYAFAGLGFDLLTKRSSKNLNLLFISILFTGTAIQSQFSSITLIPSIFTLALSAYLLIRFSKSHRLILFLACAISLVISFYHLSLRTITSTENSLFFKENNIEANNILNDLSKISNTNPLSFRYHTIDENIPRTWWSAFGIRNQLRSFSSIAPPYLKAQRDEIQIVKNEAYRRLYGSKYTIFHKTLFTDNNQKIVLNSPNYTVVENDHVAERFYLVDQVVRSRKNMKGFLKTLNKNINKIGSVAFSDVELLINRFPEKENNTASKIQIIEQKTNKSIIKCDLFKDKLLIVNEFYSKEWKIEVNKEPVEILKVNFNQMGVILNEGVNNVVIEFAPKNYSKLKWISRFSLFILFLTFLISIDKKEFLTHRFKNR